MNIGANFWPKSDKFCTIPPSKNRQPILQYFTAIIRLLSRNSSTLASEINSFPFPEIFRQNAVLHMYLLAKFFV